MQKLPLQRLTAIMFATITTAMLAGCSSTSTVSQSQTDTTTGINITKQKRFLGILSPYRPDVQQGNFISREMVAQVKPGMTPEQVRFALGTPLLSDIFHANRWDYDFRLTRRNGETLSSRVTVFFNNGTVDHLEGGDNLPSEEEYLSLISGKPVSTSTDSK